MQKQVAIKQASRWIRLLSMFLKLVMLSVLMPSAQTIAAEGEQDIESNQVALYLVRHAEKEKTSPDPSLSAMGARRAQDLMRTLKDAGVDTIYSTKTTRTRSTAQPLADLLDKSIQSYDAKELSAFSKQLKSSTGQYLIVGHSNTTPLLVKLLGGDPHGEINEAWEYDRLYVLVFNQGELVSSTLLRYGEANKK